MNKKIFCIIFVMILIYINAELTEFEIQLDDTPFEEYTTKPYVISLTNNNFFPCDMGTIPAIAHYYIVIQYDGKEINKWNYTNERKINNRNNPPTPDKPGLRRENGV